MSMVFKDYFSDVSKNYKIFRPEYPAELFEYIVSLVENNEIVWDCATGTGQTAKRLVKYFQKIIASDPSSSQISNAERADGIEYFVATAEQSNLGSATMDLITVSQALHWFCINDFFKEAERILKPGGILAVWSYNLLYMTPAIDELIQTFYYRTLGDYWPKERLLVANAYSDIEFPLQEITVPVFQMKAEWNLNELLGYISTWSAIKKFESVNKVSPMNDLHTRMSKVWGNPAEKVPVNWPLTLQIRRK
ncbi:MAG: methyltransferase domain-containing protein [Nitrospira sp.]|nr:methyltransferase domain-containing protein [Nitrospira sp.]